MPVEAEQHLECQNKLNKAIIHCIRADFVERILRDTKSALYLYNLGLQYSNCRSPPNPIFDLRIQKPEEKHEKRKIKNN